MRNGLNEIINFPRLICSIQLFTSLKASRVHIVFPKPRMMTGSWAFTMTVTSIRCNSIGNKYQLLWPNTSLNWLNWLVTISPNSQKKKIRANVQNTIINGLIISMGLETFYNSKHAIRIKIVRGRSHLIVAMWTQKSALILDIIEMNDLKDEN